MTPQLAFNNRESSWCSTWRSSNHFRALKRIAIAIALLTTAAYAEDPSQEEMKPHVLLCIGGAFAYRGLEPCHPDRDTVGDLSEKGVYPDFATCAHYADIVRDRFDTFDSLGDETVSVPPPLTLAYPTDRRDTP